MSILVKLIYSNSIAIEPTHDGVSYNRLAHTLLANNFTYDEEYGTRRAPGYPTFLAIVYTIFGKNNFASVLIVQSIVSSSLILIIFKISNYFFSTGASLLSASIVSIYPIFIYYSAIILSEILFLNLLYLAVLTVLVGGIRENTYYISAGGIFFGLATLFRPVSLLIPILFLIYYLVTVPKTRRMVFTMGVFLSLFVLTIIPWIIRNNIYYEKQFILTSEFGYQIFTSNNKYANGAGIWEPDVKKEFDAYYKEFISEYKEDKEIQSVYVKKAIEYAIENPKHYFLLMWKKFLRFWNLFPQTNKKIHSVISVASYGILLPFSIVGFLTTIKEKKVWILHLIVIYFTILHCTISYGSIRFRLSIEPILIIFGSFALSRLYNKIKINV